jgi:hypothetical protein
MNFFKYSIATLSLMTCIGTFAETSAKSAQETQTSVTQTSAIAAAAAPRFVTSYNTYHYNLKGDRGANTNIYKFGKSTVDVNLLSVTWLYSADWTFVGIMPYLTNKVETIYEPVSGGLNLTLTDVTKGPGDLLLMGVTPLSMLNSWAPMLDMGLSLPTGSIDQNFTSSPNQRASYNMQLGSGTPDFVLGTTLTKTLGQFTNSARAQGTLRGGKNKNGWALGNELQLKASSYYGINSNLSVGFAANYKNRGAVVGRDEKYEIFNSYSGTVSQAKGDGHQYYKGSQVNWDANAVAKAQTPFSKTVTGSVEFGLPVAQGLQNKDDVELKTQWYGAASLNAVF